MGYYKKQIRSMSVAYLTGHGSIHEVWCKNREVPHYASFLCAYVLVISSQ